MSAVSDLAQRRKTAGVDVVMVRRLRYDSSQQSLIHLQWYIFRLFALVNLAFMTAVKAVTKKLWFNFRMGLLVYFIFCFIF